MCTAEWAVLTFLACVFTALTFKYLADLIENNIK